MLDYRSVIAMKLYGIPNKQQRHPAIACASYVSLKLHGWWPWATQPWRGRHIDSELWTAQDVLGATTKADKITIDNLNAGRLWQVMNYEYPTNWVFMDSGFGVNADRWLKGGLINGYLSWGWWGAKYAGLAWHCICWSSNHDDISIYSIVGLISSIAIVS